MAINLIINGCPLEIFDGATIGDAIRKFSPDTLSDVEQGRSEVRDLDGNLYYLSGELTGGEVFGIEKKSQSEKNMDQSKHSLITIVLIALSLILLGTFLIRADSEETTITIFHLNDIHGTIKNMGKITSIVETEKANNPNVFLMEAGDNFSGNPVVDQYDPKGEPILVLMNKMKFDVGVLGNHDFDFGKKILKRFMKKANFPILCCNVKSNDPDFPQPEPYTVLKTENGIDLVILGLIQTEAHSGIPSTLPANVKDLRFFKGTEFALKYKYLKKDNNIFIALSHLGFGKDKELAANMKELDLIIGGHSHTLIENPAFENGVLIAQAGAHADYLGRIDIVVKNGKIISRKGSVIDLHKVKTSNKEIDKLVTDFNSESSLNNVLTVIDTTITGRNDLGLMVTDAVREDLGLDMIFYNKGGIRINRLSGKVRAKDIYSMHPFGNYIVEILMDTSEIKNLIKNDYESHRGLDIIPSGLTYRVTRDLNKKVIKVELFDLNGYRLPDNRKFRVGLNNYIVSSYNFTHKDPGKSTNAKTVDIMLRFFSNLKKKLNYSDVVRAEEKIVYSGNVKTLGVTETDIFAAKKTFYKNSPSGNLITDAMRVQTSSDLALFPTRLLREGLIIQKGKKIYKEVLPDLYSFIKQSKVIKITLTGKQLKDFIFKRTGQKNNIDLQISGASYSVLYDKENKVCNVEFSLSTDPIFSEAKSYSIAMIEYEFRNFYKLKKLTAKPERVKKGLEDILSEYIMAKKIITEQIAIPRILLKKQVKARR